MVGAGQGARQLQGAAPGLAAWSARQPGAPLTVSGDRLILGRDGDGSRNGPTGANRASGKGAVHTHQRSEEKS